jgi:hypothetical protein
MQGRYVLLSELPLQIPRLRRRQAHVVPPRRLSANGAYVRTYRGVVVKHGVQAMSQSAFLCKGRTETSLSILEPWGERFLIRQMSLRFARGLVSQLRT